LENNKMKAYALFLSEISWFQIRLW
jgi:hypothetical protein